MSDDNRFVIAQVQKVLDDFSRELGTVKISDGETALTLADLRDVEIKELLKLILLEQRITNKHLEIMNDEKVKECDLDDN